MIRVLMVALLLNALPAHAEGWLYAKHAGAGYPEAMADVQHNLAAAGFKITRIQHMDKGLRSRGFDSRDYKILYVMPPLAGPIPGDMEVALPLTILVGEDAEGNGEVATMGVSNALPLANGNMDLEIQLLAIDAQMANAITDIE